MVTATIIDNGLLTAHAAVALTDGYMEVMIESEDYEKFKTEDHMTDDELFAFLCEQYV